MPYCRTENVVRRLAAREQAILTAALALAGEGGMEAVQIAAVASRANIAAGTVYRYFPSKNDLVGEVIATVSARELTAMRAAADTAPGPLSALAAGIAAFAGRALAERKLAWAALAEPVDAAIDAMRLDFRRSIAAELALRIEAARTRQLLPEQDARAAAAAIAGAVIEGLIGPLAPQPADPGAAREAVQAIMVMALRALGVMDARARGLVAQVALP